MRKLLKNKQANLEMVTMGVVVAVVFALAIPVIFNIMGGLDLSSANNAIRTNVYGLTSGDNSSDAGNASWATWNGTIPASNATNSLLTQVNSFFSIGPIYLVVVVAVAIIATILILRRYQ